MLSEKDKAILINILESIDKIFEYSSRFKTPDLFKNESLYFDAVLMNFIVIGEMVDKLSKSFKEEYNDVKWSKIYGLRNIIAHNYFGIYEKEIWQIIQNDIKELKVKLEKIIE